MKDGRSGAFAGLAAAFLAAFLAPGFRRPARLAPQHPILHTEADRPYVCPDAGHVYRIFVADPEAVAPGLRLRERIEAAFVDHLYEQPPPRCGLPDRGTLQPPASR